MERRVTGREIVYKRNRNQFHKLRSRKIIYEFIKTIMTNFYRNKSLYETANYKKEGLERNLADEFWAVSQIKNLSEHQALFRLQLSTILKRKISNLPELSDAFIYHYKSWDVRETNSKPKYIYRHLKNISLDTLFRLIDFSIESIDYKLKNYKMKTQ